MLRLSLGGNGSLLMFVNQKVLAISNSERCPPAPEHKHETEKGLRTQRGL